MNTTTHHTEHSSNAQDITQTQSIFNAIREGMTVYDRDNHRLGDVERIHFGAASEEQLEHGTGPATTGTRYRTGENWLTESLADIFDPSEVPQELAEKLWRTGFIRLDSAGLFASDRYIMPDQIAAVQNDGVYLNVAREDLIQRS
jgi:hypothetical protein